MRTILLIALLPSGCMFATMTHYVWSGATGPANGSSFQNAFKDLPPAINCGDVYVVAGDPIKYPPHRFAQDCASNPVTIRKANFSQDSSVPGFTLLSDQSQTPATWQDVTEIDPLSVTAPVWTICGGGYVFDGITGNTDPRTGPVNFGFEVVSANPTKSPSALIQLGCSSSPEVVSNVSLKHLHYGGMGKMPFFGYTVSCQYSEGMMSLVSTSNTFSFITGDKIDGWSKTGSTLGLFSNLGPVTVSGSKLSVKVSKDYCPANGGTLYQISLSTPTFYGFIAQFEHMQFQHITLQYDYFSYGLEAVDLFNCSFCLIDHNYFANNRTTPWYHGSMVDLRESDATRESGPITISSNFVLDATGTGTFTHLGQAIKRECAGGERCGTINGLAIVGNVVTCDRVDMGRCAIGYTASDNANTCVQNSAFLNNTMANLSTVDGSGQPLGRAGVQWISSCSKGNVAYNNLVWQVNYNTFYAGSGLLHDYNVTLNSPNKGTVASHEMWRASGQRDPFVVSSRFDFRLAADGDLPKGIRTSAASKVNDIDFLGNGRDSGKGWNVGAYAFRSSERSGNDHEK